MAKLIEIEKTQTMSREEAADALRRLADLLAADGDLEFDRDGTEFTIPVPDEVKVEFEIEIETDESSIEVELSW